MDVLSKIYYDPSDPGSFGGYHRLSKYAKVSLKTAQKFLESQNTYNKHKRALNKYTRRKIVVPEIDYLWQADLVIIKNIAKYNKNYNYLLCVIDVLSRYAFVRPLKKKTGNCVTLAFESIFKDSKRRPKYIETDEGLEFHNSTFSNFLKTNNIILYHNHSPLKSAMVERFNRTLMTRLYKLMEYIGNFKFITHLEEIVSSYNHTKHRIIKYCPAEVNEFNQMDVWLNSYKDLYSKNFKPANLKVGDIVRIKVNKNTFSKGYTSSFSSQLYKIDKVMLGKPVSYKISTLSGTQILGIFYDQELSQVR